MTVNANGGQLQPKSAARLALLVLICATGAMLLLLSTRGVWGANTVVTNVTVGSAPLPVAVNVTTNRIYVANYNSNNVSVIDGATNTVAYVTVGSRPYGVGVNTATNRIYAANNAAHTVSVINGATNVIVGLPVSVGHRPFGVGVNETTNLVYVANLDDDTVSVIDGATNAVIGLPVSVGDGPIGVAVNSKTNRIYVANYSSNNVSVIDASMGNAVTNVPVGSGATGVAVDAITNRIYVANYGSNNVSVIDGTNNTVVATIPVGSAPQGVGVNTATNRIHVANRNSNNVSVIDGTTNAVVATLLTGNNPFGVGVNANTNRVYVANESSNNVTVMEDSLATGYSVTRFDDPTPDGCPLNGCSLREAISAANAAPGANVITLPAGTFTLTRVGSAEDLNATGDLDITDDLTINGAGAASTIIAGRGGDAVLALPFTATATVSDVTVTGAMRGISVGSFYGGQPSMLTLNRSTVSGSDEGILKNGTAILNDSTVTGSPVGIWNYQGILTLNNSTVSGNGNGNQFFGGIITSAYPAYISLNNSTISGNHTRGLILNSTGGTLTLKNTILDNLLNCDFASQAVALVSQGYNLSTDNSCQSTASGGPIVIGGLNGPGDLNSTPANLAPLSLNTPGSTMTHALCTGPNMPHPTCTGASLAIDHIPFGESGCGKPLTTDQRGLIRPQPLGGNCDIGAYEEGQLPLPSISSTGTYCVSGESTGVGWLWEVQVVTKPAQVVTKPPLYHLVSYPGEVQPGLPVGSPANVIADTWVANIEMHPQFDAYKTSPNCFGLKMLAAANARTPSSFHFYVEGCPLNQPPAQCSFNPTVSYVAPIGGTAELIVGGTGSPSTGPTRYAASAAALALLAIAGWYARRRVVRR